MQTFTIRLTEEELSTVHKLAARRGTQPNDVIRQALAIEKLLAEHMKPNDELLIKKPGGRMQKVIFQTPYKP